VDAVRAPPPRLDTGLPPPAGRPPAFGVVLTVLSAAAPVSSSCSTTFSLPIHAPSAPDLGRRQPYHLLAEPTAAPAYRPTPVDKTVRPGRFFDAVPRCAPPAIPEVDPWFPATLLGTSPPRRVPLDLVPRRSRPGSLKQRYPGHGPRSCSASVGSGTELTAPAPGATCLRPSGVPVPGPYGPRGALGPSITRRALLADSPGPRQPVGPVLGQLWSRRPPPSALNPWWARAVGRAPGPKDAAVCRPPRNPPPSCPYHCPPLPSSFLYPISYAHPGGSARAWPCPVRSSLLDRPENHAQETEAPRRRPALLGPRAAELDWALERWLCAFVGPQAGSSSSRLARPVWNKQEQRPLCSAPARRRKPFCSGTSRAASGPSVVNPLSVRRLGRTFRGVGSPR